MSKTVKAISELVVLSLSSKNNDQIKYSIGKISSKVARKIKNETGLDVENYDCVIDNFAIRHAILHHGNAAKESANGQIAVTIDYFEKIPLVLSFPDKISDGGTTKVGRRSIIYEKRLNGIILFIQEVRTKKKELAMVTMYIKKAR